MNENNLPEFYKHLADGGRIVFVATPSDSEYDKLVWAVDLKFTYEAKEIPGGSWIGDPIRPMPEGTTPESIFEATFKTIGAMSEQVGGAMLKAHIAKPDTTKQN